MYAINSYLDLGAGVLILWYGGNLAMGNHEGGLTPGQLITFQLYWNLINGAYKGLIDILTNFTRSAGAASRIFSLIDALPDIDVDSGTPLSRDEIHGEIEFRKVGFHYQMRPDHKVSPSSASPLPNSRRSWKVFNCSFALEPHVRIRLLLGPHQRQVLWLGGPEEARAR
jgi:ABC-type bacteriocin/lantibiotic exporter with double-glycine peptidase domain